MATFVSPYQAESVPSNGKIQIPLPARFRQNTGMVTFPSPSSFCRFLCRSALGRTSARRSQQMLLLALLPLCLSASPPALGQTPASLQGALFNVVEQFVRVQTQGYPGRVDISVSPLDPSTTLQACANMEAFLNPGAKLWGRSSVGVRCTAGSNWMLYVGVQVSVHGNYLVSTHPMVAGQAVQSGDVTLASGDLTTLPAGVATDLRQLQGKTLKMPLNTGQPLRLDFLVAPILVKQGQPVRLSTRGNGFAITGEGVALGNGAEGQTINVRTANGQSISGVVRPDGSVEIRF